eukprot:712088-Pyramimonas_sp.AAC.1
MVCPLSPVLPLFPAGGREPVPGAGLPHRDAQRGGVPARARLPRVRQDANVPAAIHGARGGKGAHAGDGVGPGAPRRGPAPQEAGEKIKRPPPFVLPL